MSAESLCLCLIVPISEESFNINLKTFENCENLFAGRNIFRHKFGNYYVFVMQLTVKSDQMDFYNKIFLERHSDSVYGAIFNNFAFWKIIIDWEPHYLDFMYLMTKFFGREDTYQQCTLR